MTENDISTIGLTNRACNILRRNGIETIQDIIDNLNNLTGLHNLGVAMAKEITDKVRPYLSPQSLTITQDGIKTSCFAYTKRGTRELCSALDGWYSSHKDRKCYKCPFYKTRQQLEAENDR